MNISIQNATTQRDFNDARSLFRAYGAHLSANPSGSTNICIDGFEQEVAGLPGKYASPHGIILLARVDDAVAGCVALRPLGLDVQEDRSCEMKRLWIGGTYRGLGLGRKLVQSAIAQAQAMNYQSIYLDTVPAAMPEANALYQGIGFLQIERYNHSSVPDIVFFRLKLQGADSLRS